LTACLNSSSSEIVVPAHAVAAIKIGKLKPRTCDASNIPKTDQSPPHSALTLRTALLPPLPSRFLDQEIVELLPLLEGSHKPPGSCPSSRPSFSGRTMILRRDFSSFQRTSAPTHLLQFASRVGRFCCATFQTWRPPIVIVIAVTIVRRLSLAQVWADSLGLNEATDAAVQERSP
jgi:hypothetical protein